MHTPANAPRLLIERGVLTTHIIGDALLGHVSSRLVAQIHDELLFEVEDSQIAEFAGKPGGNRPPSFPE